jgi:peptidyl-prolyl cis-trans isomerase A (cyclophilin A)
MITSSASKRLSLKLSVNLCLSLLATIALAVSPQWVNAQPASAVKVSPKVSVKTSMGEIIIELYPDKAPKTVENFLGYVKDGYYSGTIFHRVINNFMIQGGGMDRKLVPKPTRGPIQIESRNGLKNKAGWVSMARTSQPDSATSQFFISTVDNPDLDFPAPDGHGYTVFGKVVKGIEVVNKIRAVPTIRNGAMGDVPIDPIIIDSVSLVAGK